MTVEKSGAALRKASSRPGRDVSLHGSGTQRVVGLGMQALLLGSVTVHSDCHCVRAVHCRHAVCFPRQTDKNLEWLARWDRGRTWEGSMCGCVQYFIFIIHIY